MHFRRHLLLNRRNSINHLLLQQPQLFQQTICSTSKRRNPLAVRPRRRTSKSSGTKTLLLLFFRSKRSLWINRPILSIRRGLYCLRDHPKVARARTTWITQVYQMLVEYYRLAAAASMNMLKVKRFALAVDNLIPAKAVSTF